MHYIEAEDLTAVDIDDTLVFMVDKAENADITILDPYGILGYVHLVIHRPHVNCIKRGYNRGNRFFAWSRGGAKWAYTVVHNLGLEEYFKFTCAKPTKYIDDSPVQEWMTERTYLDKHKVGWQAHVSRFM